MSKSKFFLLILGMLVVLVAGTFVFIFRSDNSIAPTFEVVVLNQLDATNYIYLRESFVTGSLLRQLGANENPNFIDTIRVTIIPNYSGSSMVARQMHLFDKDSDPIIVSAINFQLLNDELILNIFLSPEITNINEKLFYLNSSFITGYFYGHELYKERSLPSYSADYELASSKAGAVFMDEYENQNYAIQVE